MARNLFCEHRIPEERMMKFLGFAGPLSSLDLLHDALDRYQREHVRPSRDTNTAPAHARPENESNAVELTTHLGGVLG
jgi:hypothetical protein